MRTKYHEDFDLVLAGLENLVDEFQHIVNLMFSTDPMEFNAPKLSIDRLGKYCEILKPYVLERKFDLSGTDFGFITPINPNGLLFDVPETLWNAARGVHDFFRLMQQYSIHSHTFSSPDFLAFGNFSVLAFEYFKVDFGFFGDITNNDTFSQEREIDSCVFLDSDLRILARMSKEVFKKQKSTYWEDSDKIRKKSNKKNLLRGYSFDESTSEGADFSELFSHMKPSGTDTYFPYTEVVKWLTRRQKFKHTHFYFSQPSNLKIPNLSNPKVILEKVSEKQGIPDSLEHIFPEDFLSRYKTGSYTVSIYQALLLDYTLYLKSNPHNSEYIPFSFLLD